MILRKRWEKQPRRTDFLEELTDKDKERQIKQLKKIRERKQ